MKLETSKTVNDVETQNNIYRIFRRIEANYQLLNALAKEHGTPEQQYAFKEAVYGTCMALSSMLIGEPMKKCRREEFERLEKIQSD